MLTKGVPIYLTGRVFDRRGQPLTNAAVEIWQCDANAVYHHPAGGAEAERDPNFQGYGVARTDATGAFHFRTIKPIAYPGRTSHIHVRVQPARRVTLRDATVFGATIPGNRRDFLFSRMSADEQAALTLKFEPTPAAAHRTCTRARDAMDRARGSCDRLTLGRLIQRHHLVDVALQFPQPGLAARVRRQKLRGRHHRRLTCPILLPQAQ